MNAQFSYEESENISKESKIVNKKTWAFIAKYHLIAKEHDTAAVSHFFVHSSCAIVRGNVIKYTTSQHAPNVNSTAACQQVESIQIR